MSHKTKNFVYRMLWVAVGALLSTVLIGLISMVMIYNNLQGDWVLALYFLVLLLAGVLVGLICGRIAWHKVYVEGVRGEKYVKEHHVRLKEFETQMYKNMKDFDIDRMMKWTVTVFLIFLMVLMSGAIAFALVFYAKLHLGDYNSIIKQIFAL